jgi:hypothetical protein
MTTWHAPPELLERFATAPEALDHTTASSVEQHLMTCAACRGLVAAGVEPGALERSWAQIADVVDRPRTRATEHLLGRLGMSEGLARVVGATVSLRVAWLGAVGLVAGAAVAAAQQDGADTSFLVLAPLVPLGAVLLTFLAADDPAGEAGTATPMHGAGLLLHRALTVLVPTFLILALASLGQPDLGRASLWILPALALTVSALALTTVVRATTATFALSLAWLLAVLATAALDGQLRPIDDSVTFGVGGQVVAVVMTIGAAMVLHARRDRLSSLEVQL